MTREQQSGAQQPADGPGADMSQVGPLPMNTMDMAEEEQQLFPVFAVDIAEEETRPLPGYQDEIAERVFSPGVNAATAPVSPTPFLGLPEEKTPWPEALRPNTPKKTVAPPTPFLGLPEEKTPWPEVLSVPAGAAPIPSAQTRAAPTPLGYIQEIAERTTQLLPIFRHLQQAPRRRISLLLACVSGLLVVVLLTTSVLALRGQQPQQQTRRQTSATPSRRSTSAGKNPTAVVPTAVPTSAPQAQPVQPFPSTLAAQISTLEAHDRFFYNGNINLPEVALTFDDGPSPAYTPQVLAILKRYHINATFFDIGRLVQAYPNLVRQELKAGNDVGNHTWTHPDMPLLTQQEMKAQIQQTSDAIEKAIGIRPTYMRPPYGSISSRVLPVINSFGLTTVIWNDEARDWSLPGTSVIVARILNLARNGAIILLHDGGGVRAQTVQALPTIIERLRARGYAFVTMDELVAHIHKNKQGGTPSPTPTPGAGTGTPAHEGIWGEPGILEPWWETFDPEKKIGLCGC
ncbi:MAG TPA: polysaccharide deacetylase family protein [Ktedonobacteraceae bacterium]